MHNPINVMIVSYFFTVWVCGGMKENEADKRTLHYTEQTFILSDS